MEFCNKCLPILPCHWNKNLLLIREPYNLGIGTFITSKREFYFLSIQLTICRSFYLKKKNISVFLVIFHNPVWLGMYFIEHMNDTRDIGNPYQKFQLEGLNYVYYVTTFFKIQKSEYLINLGWFKTWGKKLRNVYYIYVIRYIYSYQPIYILDHGPWNVHHKFLFLKEILHEYLFFWGRYSLYVFFYLRRYNKKISISTSNSDVESESRYSKILKQKNELNSTGPDVQCHSQGHSKLRNIF